MNTITSLPSERVPDSRILPAVWTLLLLRVRITYNSFRHAKLRRKIGTIIVWLLILAFAGFLLTMSWLLLGFMRSPELTRYVGMDPQPLLEAIPVLILTGLFIGILLTSFGVLLQALYLSGDMDFLLTTPVPIRAVFVAKLLQAVLPNFALVSLFGLPVLFGLGFSGGYNILYYPLVLLTMIVLALAAAGLSSLLVMLVVRIMPPRRAAEILGFFGALIGFTCSQMGNLSNSFRNQMQDVSSTQLSGLLMRANTPWLPLNWAGQGLIALGEGHWLTGLPLVGLTLGLATAAFWFALVTSERWYYSGWAGMQVIERKKKPTRTSQPVTGEQENAFSRLTRLLPPPVWGIVWKDFLTLRRDLRSLSQLISPLIMGVIYTLMMFRGGRSQSFEGGDIPQWVSSSIRVVTAYGNVGMSLFVGWILLARLAGLGFSHEGKNYWMLKASPVHTGHLLAAKFLVAYLPTLGLGLFFLTGISILQKLSVVEFLYSLVTVTLCLAGLAGILLSFGVLGANFTWDDPRKMNSGAIGCFGQILTMLYLPVAFGLFIGPLGLASLFHLPLLAGYLAGLVLGVSFTVGCAYVPLWLVQKKVASLDEA
jgi:ABC-2 type transport system permease protein